MTTTHQHRNARRAFTLIEVLIVLVILLTLGGIVVVNVMPKKEQSDINATKVQLDQFEAALDMFKLDMNRYPTEEEGLSVLWSPTNLEEEEDEAKWKGPYLKEPKPRDLWGGEWVYQYPGQLVNESMYDIISLGPDGEEDTDDDINNHYNMMDAEGEVSEDFEDFGEGDDVTSAP
jgi:general secretion pathway protein G